MINFSKFLLSQGYRNPLAAKNRESPPNGRKPGRKIVVEPEATEKIQGKTDKFSGQITSNKPKILQHPGLCLKDMHACDMVGMEGRSPAPKRDVERSYEP